EKFFHVGAAIRLAVAEKVDVLAHRWLILLGQRYGGSFSESPGKRPRRVNQASQRYASGAAKRIESTTSRTPPKPGITCSASFCRHSRLISASDRSPSTPAPPTVNPKPAAVQSSPRSAGTRRVITTATVTAKTSTPASP